MGAREACYPEHYKGALLKKQAAFEKSFWDYMKPLMDQPGQKLVMSGSARQDITSDWKNRDNEDMQFEGFPDLQHDRRKEEGLITTDLPCLAEQLGAEIYPLLFADGDGEAGVAWKNRSRTISQHGPAGYFWEDRKASLLRFQIDRLRQHLGDDKRIHIYFFDDREDILKEVASRVKLADKAAGWRGLPEGVKLTCIHLDWFGSVYEDGNGLKVHDDTDVLARPSQPTPTATSAPTAFLRALSASLMPLLLGGLLWQIAPHALMSAF